MTSSSTIASCRLRARLRRRCSTARRAAFHAASPPPLRSDGDRPAAAAGSSSTSALPRSKTLAGAAGRADEARPRRRPRPAAPRSAGWRRRRRGRSWSPIGTAVVVGRRPARGRSACVVVAGDGRGRRRRSAAAERRTRRCGRGPRRRRRRSLAVDGRRRSPARRSASPAVVGVEPATSRAGDGRGRRVASVAAHCEHRAQRDDAGDVDGVERVALVLDAGQVDDDVRALDADVGLGDAAASRARRGSGRG